MKYFTVFLLLGLSINLVQAETSSSCPGEEGFYFTNYKRRNPTLGGFVSYQASVDDTEELFIARTAAVCGGSNIQGSPKIFGTSVIRNAKVSGNAEINGSAKVENGAEVTDEARITENARITGSVRVSGKAYVGGNAAIFNHSENDFAEVTENARVTANAEISGNSLIRGRARVMGQAKVFGDTVVEGSAMITGYARLSSGIISSGTLDPAEPKNEVEAKDAVAKAKAQAEKVKKEAAAREYLQRLVVKMNDQMEEGISSNGDGMYKHSFSNLGNCRFKLFYETHGTDARQINTVKIIFDLKESIEASPDRFSVKFYKPTFESQEILRNDGSEVLGFENIIYFNYNEDVTKFMDTLSALKNNCKI